MSCLPSGVQFTFPPGATLAPGGYLVVAADPVEFTNLYGPVDHLVGPWFGSLSNRGERIKIVETAGASPK